MYLQTKVSRLHKISSVWLTAGRDMRPIGHLRQKATQIVIYLILIKSKRSLYLKRKFVKI